MSLLMTALGLLPALPITAIVPMAFYSCSDSVQVFIDKLRGKAVVEITDWRTDKWKSTLFTNALGEVFAYRYPAVKVGKVILNPDGSGNYCGGNIKWKRL